MSNTKKAETIEAIPKPPRTASREVRRQQLINATIESIAKHGISGTTMTTVTGFAGLSMGLVNFHFKTKEFLFEETLRFLAEEHRDQWKKSYDKAELAPEAKLLAIVDAHFHPKICSRKKLAVWFGFYGEARNRSNYRKIMHKIDPERWERSKRLCAQIITDGGYEHADAKVMADTLEGLYDGYCLNILIYPDDYSRENAKTQIRIYLATAFPKHFEIPPQT